MDSSDGPELPAATTNSAPVSAVSLFTACDMGSVPSLGNGSPRLMLITSAPLFAAHSMPAMIPDSLPPPESSSTLPFSSFASGATPWYFPPDFAPLPVMIDATCVPCPKWSSAPVSLPVKSRAPATASARSGCVASTPVSSTATVAPFPVWPADHASGAPICGTLRSRLTRTGASSQILLADLPAPAQNAGDLSARTATALTAGRFSVTFAPAARGVAPG